MGTHVYRLIRTSWGIWIKLTAHVSPGEHPDAIVVSPGHPVRLAFEGSAAEHCADDREELARGLAVVAPAIPGPVTVTVSEILYSLCDFQPDGLPVAMCRWAEAEFGLPPRVIGESYDREAKRYLFDWQN